MVRLRGSCDSAYAYVDYKWMSSVKFYNDNSAVYLSWDNETIDSFPDAYGFLDLIKITYHLIR